jgi:hypothetical protein
MVSHYKQWVNREGYTLTTRLSLKEDNQVSTEEISCDHPDKSTWSRNATDENLKKKQKKIKELSPRQFKLALIKSEPRKFVGALKVTYLFFLSNEDYITSIFI